MKLIITAIATVLLVGCAVEERSAESTLVKAKVESQATDVPAVIVESSVTQAKVPFPGNQESPPTMSIHDAAAKGNIGIVRQHLAIQPGDYVNTRTPSDWTPLHFAYAQGRSEIIRFLLDNGADYEAKNKLGQAPADIPLLKRNFNNSQFALVELYTSESCSSCPPAEQLTSQIRRMALAKRLNRASTTPPT